MDCPLKGFSKNMIVMGNLLPLTETAPFLQKTTQNTGPFNDLRHTSSALDYTLPFRHAEPAMKTFIRKLTPIGDEISIVPK